MNVQELQNFNVGDLVSAYRYKDNCLLIGIITNKLDVIHIGDVFNVLTEDGRLNQYTSFALQKLH